MPQRPMINSRPHNTHEYGEESFWLKKNEERLARERRLTVIVRQGDRTDESKTPVQFVSVSKPIPVFYIAKEGDQTQGVKAQFHPDDGTTVEVVKQKVVQLGLVKDEDLKFENGTAVPQTATEVRTYLEEELAPGKKYADDQLLTLSYIRYLQPAFCAGLFICKKEKPKGV